MDRREELERLYRRSFDESEGYLEFFYKRRFKDNAVTIEQDGEIVSALYYFDRKLQVGQSAAKASFISAAATLPELRGRGIMRETLLKAFDGMRARGNVLAYLYPFKHEYYERFDFVTFSFMAEKKYSCRKNIATQKDINAIKDLYYEYVKDFNCYTLRSGNDFLEILDGIYADGGSADFLVNENGENIGYHLRDASSDLDEFVCPGGSVFSSSGESCYIPSGEGQKYSMARCLNVLELLKIADYIPKDRVMSVKINDGLIRENNIIAEIDLKSSRVLKSCGDKYDFEMSISDVTKCVLGLPYGKFCEYFKHNLNINYEKY